MVFEARIASLALLGAEAALATTSLVLEKLERVDYTDQVVEEVVRLPLVSTSNLMLCMLSNVPNESKTIG